MTPVSRVKKLEKTVKQLRTTRLVGDVPAAERDVDIQDDVDLDGLLLTAVAEPAGPSVAADKGKAPLPELDIPAEFVAEDAQARKRFEEEQASERLVQRLRAEDLAQEDLPNVSEERAKELDDLMMRMTETDWLNLMMQVGSNPALAKELLGADVNEGNFIERMTAVKERKKRALADLRYRALKGKPLKKSEVTQLMRNLVKNQWCAAHNGTITMKEVKAMNKKQLVEEYEYICRRLEKDRLLSAQYNLFRPKPAITEPPSKRQRVERASSQPASVPAATTHTADDPDSAGGGSSNPAGSAFGAPVTDSTVTTPAAMDSAGSHRKIGVSLFVDSAASSSPSNVSTDHIPIDVLFESTSGGINDFFLESDEEEQIGMSRVAADPDSDDEVLAEIIFRGKSISGDGVVLVDKLPDDEIVDPRVKVETVSDYASSPPRSRRKHLGVRSDEFLWDKPVEDFFSSESESDADMENYIPPLPYGEFKDWEMVSCPPGNSYIHVYYQQNRRRKYFTYLKQLLPHVYREDILLLRRRMNRYFRLNPDVNIGLDLWRDVNMLCQSLHSDDVEDFWRTQDEWIVSSWKLYPKSSVHVLDLTNGKTVLTVPPSYCRVVILAGNIIQTVQTGLRQSYECLASAPIACTARQMVFSSPWLTAKKESGSPLQTALVLYLNLLMVCWLPKMDVILFPCSCWDENGLVNRVRLLELASQWSKRLQVTTSVEIKNTTGQGERCSVADALAGKKDQARTSIRARRITILFWTLRLRLWKHRTTLQGLKKPQLSVGGVRKLIMDEAHTSRYSVHPGADKMYYDLRDLYWWPGMKRDIAEYISRCITCSKIKAEHQNPQDFLQLEIPEWYLMEGSGTFGENGKLAPRYVGPFEIRLAVLCWTSAYRREVTPGAKPCRTNTFHVSNLKKCLAEPDVQVPLDEIEIDENLRFVEEPIKIIERDVKKLKRRRIPLVKVRWNSWQGVEYTWEHEDQFQKKYPHLFSEPVPSSNVATGALRTRLI
ncbi:putative ribonuclease H-like domain-containing protein [Tanacetum coccineum]